jgi:hypothetical protein
MRFDAQQGRDRLWKGNLMAAKKKPRFRAEKEARRRARLGIGMPPPARTIPDKRLKPPKHKKPLITTIEE